MCSDPPFGSTSGTVKTILYYILYYTILHYTILYYTILYYTILYYTILYYTNDTILYYTILYYTILKSNTTQRMNSPPKGDPTTQPSRHYSCATFESRNSDFLSVSPYKGFPFQGFPL